MRAQKQSGCFAVATALCRRAQVMATHDERLDPPSLNFGAASTAKRLLHHPDLQALLIQCAIAK